MYNIFKFFTIINILFTQKSYIMLSKLKQMNNFNGSDMRQIPIEDPNIKNKIKNYFYKKTLLDKLKNVNITLEHKINIIKNIEYQKKYNINNTDFLE